MRWMEASPCGRYDVGFEDTWVDMALRPGVGLDRGLWLVAIGLAGEHRVPVVVRTTRLGEGSGRAETDREVAQAAVPATGTA